MGPNRKKMKCCNFDMLERKDRTGPIYWCASCGKKVPREESPEGAEKSK